MSGFREAESFEAELAKVEERLREIERIEAKLLVNIPHTGFRTASEEARLRSEKEMLSDTAANLGAELLWQSMASGVFWPTPC